MGHRAVDGQSHVTVWGPQTLGGGCLWCKQALTETLTNNTHSYRKCSYLYQLRPPPPNNQVTVQRWSMQETKGTDMKKETKQTSFWQHAKCIWAVSLHLTRTPLCCRDVTLGFLCEARPLQATVIKQWSKVNERWMDRHITARTI